jgi:hypothetical protein
VGIIAHCPAFEKSITVNLSKVHKSETNFGRFDGLYRNARKSDKSSYGQGRGKWCTIIPGSFPISHPLEPRSGAERGSFLFHWQKAVAFFAK